MISIFSAKVAIIFLICKNFLFFFTPCYMAVFKIEKVFGLHRCTFADLSMYFN